jgi:hypothetical protein
MRGGKRREREGENRVVREKGGAFQTSRLLKSEHASESRREEKEDTARTIHKGDTHLVTDRGVGQFRSPKSRVRHFHLAGGAPGQ